MCISPSCKGTATPPAGFLPPFPDKPENLFPAAGLRPGNPPEAGPKTPLPLAPNPFSLETQRSMNLQELKRKTPAELLAFAEELQIEDASSLRKQDMMFAVLKQLAATDVPISGDGVLEVLSDASAFLLPPHSYQLSCAA